MSNVAAQLMAGGDIRPSRFVKRDSSANFQCLEADANERVCGISGAGTRSAPYPGLASTNHAESGDPVILHGEGESGVLLEMAATCSAGDRLKSDADGKGTPVASSGTTLQHWGAIAEEACTVIGQKIKVTPNFDSQYPAIA